MNESQPLELSTNEPSPAELSEDEPEPVALPEGTVLVCADDDNISRMMLKKTIRLEGLNADQIKSIVLGETLDEAQGLVQTVMDITAQVGDRKVICIFDQFMEYETETVLGTNATAELRGLGFQGVVLIRSANDEYSAREMCG